MEKLPLLGVILMSLPEAVLITLVALELINVRVKFRQLLLIGVLDAILAYYIRQYAPNLIVNLLAQGTANLLITVAVVRVKVIPYFIGIALSLAVYLALESLFIGILIPMAGFSIHVVINNIWLRISTFSIQGASFFGIYIVIRKYKLHILGDSSAQQ